jgi:hypothetical protein
MWKALRRAGETAPRWQVQRLMRAHGIHGAKRRGKKWITTRPDPQAGSGGVGLHRPEPNRVPRLGQPRPAARSARRPAAGRVRTAPRPPDAPEAVDPDTPQVQVDAPRPPAERLTARQPDRIDVCARLGVHAGPDGRGHLRVGRFSSAGGVADLQAAIAAGVAAYRAGAVTR